MDLQGPGTSPRGRRALQEQDCGGRVFPALPGTSQPERTGGPLGLDPTRASPHRRGHGSASPPGASPGGHTTASAQLQALRSLSRAAGLQLSPTLDKARW